MPPGAPDIPAIHAHLQRQAASQHAHLALRALDPLIALAKDVAALPADGAGHDTVRKVADLRTRAAELLAGSARQGDGGQKQTTSFVDQIAAWWPRIGRNHGG